MPCGGHIAVQEGVDGALRAAAGAVISGEAFHKALRRGRCGGVVCGQIYRQGHCCGHTGHAKCIQHPAPQRNHDMPSGADTNENTIAKIRSHSVILLMVRAPL